MTLQRQIGFWLLALAGVVFLLVVLALTARLVWQHWIG